MEWLRQHPDVKTIRVAAADLNGVARGKRMPARFAPKLMEEGTKFPYSVLNLDIWGEDIDDSPLVFESGDPDGSPYDGDPRQALARVVARYKAAGLVPVVATELEFFLIDDSGRQLRVAPSPRSGKRRTGGEVLSLRALDAFDQYFTSLYDACEMMDIPADTSISEPGRDSSRST